MRRMAFAVIAIMGFCAAPARADTLPLVIFEGVPATYTPGTDFTFTIRVPALPEFTGYAVELVFTTLMPDPPLLAMPSLNDAPADRYVFGADNQRGLSFGFPPGEPEIRLLLSDPLPFDPLAPAVRPGVFVVEGENDLIATITVKPGSELTGPISITVGRADFAYNMEAMVYDPPSDPIVVNQANSDGGNPVPAPPGVVLLGFGGLLLGLRSRLGRSAK